MATKTEAKKTEAKKFTCEIEFESAEVLRKFLEALAYPKSKKGPIDGSRVWAWSGTDPNDYP